MQSLKLLNVWRKKFWMDKISRKCSRRLGTFRTYAVFKYPGHLPEFSEHPMSMRMDNGHRIGLFSTLWNSLSLDIGQVASYSWFHLVLISKTFLGWWYMNLISLSRNIFCYWDFKSTFINCFYWVQLWGLSLSETHIFDKMQVLYSVVRIMNCALFRALPLSRNWFQFVTLGQTGIILFLLGE